MINRQDCYNALFSLKNAGIDISEQLQIMQENSGVPREIIEFLRDNSPQFQFYRYIQKFQKALAESILDCDTLDDISKLIACSSFITRVMIAIKYKNLSEDLIDDLNIEEVSNALNYAIKTKDLSKVNTVLEKHREALKLFYKNNKE